MRGGVRRQRCEDLSVGDVFDMRRLPCALGTRDVATEQRVDHGVSAVSYERALVSGGIALDEQVTCVYEQVVDHCPLAVRASAAVDFGDALYSQRDGGLRRRGG